MARVRIMEITPHVFEARKCQLFETYTLPPLRKPRVLPLVSKSFMT